MNTILLQKGRSVMRRKSIFLIVFLGLALTLTACGGQASTDVNALDEANTDSNKSEASVNETITEEAETQPLVETLWSLQYETTFDYKAYSSAFQTKDLGLVVGYVGEVHTTTDGGVNWPQSDNQSSCMYSLDFVDSNIIFTCGNNGNVFKSTDGGKTFTTLGVFTEESPIKLYDISFLDENNGIIASQERMEITNDGGVTWTEVEQSKLIAGILMVSPMEFYYIGSDYCLYKTVDSGSTWEVIPLNLPLEKDYNNSAQSFAIYKDGDNAFTLYCTQKSTKLLKSYSTTDNCATWTENAMPEVVGPAIINLNKEGNVLSYHNASKYWVKIFIKD